MGREVFPKVELAACTQCVPNPGYFDLEEDGGSMLEIVGRAAGICHDREEKESYEDFIRRIIKMGHDSVLEHLSFTFRVDGVSRALTHQLVRHRIASYSQRSQRFCTEDKFGYVVPSKLKDKTGMDVDFWAEWYTNRMEDAQNAYQYAINHGIRPEDARFVLPNACETKIFITMNARELRHFFKLRMAKDAQWEIRRMACMMWDLLRFVPVIFDDLFELRSSDWNEGFK